MADKSPIPIDQNPATICKAPCPILDLPLGSHWLFAEAHVFTDVGTSEG